jgi:cytochrome c oxidase subunit 4
MAHEHIVPVRVYILVFLALLVLTGVTAGVAFIDLGPFNLIVAIAIACLKASLVVLFFMHIAYSSKLTKAIVISGVGTLLILFSFTLFDLVARGWLANTHSWMGVPGR